MVGEGGDILGYFAVSFKELLLDGMSLSNSRVKQLDGISRRAERIRAYLIGQIAKNTALTDNPIGLSDLLEEVYAVISAAQTLVGGRVVILECEDVPKLIGLYEKHGFTLIKTVDDRSPKFRTLYSVIGRNT